MMVVFDFPALKPRGLVVSNTPRRCHDSFLEPDKPENIGNQIKTKLKNSAIWEFWKPLKAGLKFKIQLLAEFCSTNVWHKIHWYLWLIERCRVSGPWSRIEWDKDLDTWHHDKYGYTTGYSMRCINVFWCQPIAWRPGSLVRHPNHPFTPFLTIAIGSRSKSCFEGISITAN